jgi:hypothetical protein
MTIESLYMAPINWLKVGVIWLCDLVNLLWDPFNDYVEEPMTQDLGSLEALFAADIEARFVQPSGEFWYQIPRPSDAGDTALFQGLFTGYKIMSGGDITQQLSFIQTLFKNGVLIRGYYPNGEPNDTTSNDSATGLLFFFYTALRWGTPAVRSQAGALIRTWINSLMAHGGCLVDLNGQTTPYGALDNGVISDPLRVTLYLAILAVGMAYWNDAVEIYSEYARIYSTYRPMLAYPKVKFLWWDTDYDTHRAAIHTHVAWWVTKDDIYKKALQRIWRISHKTNNAWVYTLCRDALDTRDDALVGRMLGTFSFQKRQLGNIQSLNPTEPSVYWPPNMPAWAPSLGQPQLKCRYALPIYKRGSQDFFWQRGSFSLNEWMGNVNADTYHSGLDILICGWLASRLEIL